MKGFIQSFMAYYQAFLFFLGVGIIGFVFYEELTTPYNIVVATMAVVIGFLGSRFIFHMIKRRGLISTMTGDNASYELDDLDPTEGRGVLKLDLVEFYQLYLGNSIKFGQGKVSIWGDHHGKLLEEYHLIEDVQLDELRQIIVLKFNTQCTLTIVAPQHIFYTNTYLKIIKAKEIVWQTKDNSGQVHQYQYINGGNKLLTSSNTNWKPHKFDAGIGMNALYIQFS